MTDAPEHDSASGAARADCSALTEDAGFCILEDRAVVRATGEDRVAFFHGMSSNDFKGAKLHSVVPALFLTERAHVLSDCFLWVEEDALILEAGLSCWPRTREHLERLLVADDVEMEEMGALAVLHVAGPRAAQALDTAGIPGGAELRPWTFSKAASLLLGKVPRFGDEAFSMLGDRSLLGEIAKRLEAAGVRGVSEQALDVLRVGNGIAKVGVDTDDKTIALEARFERAISFTKGCYVGQETIERATARGALKKKLFGLRLERRVQVGAALFLDGKEVGRVSSSVMSPRLGPIGLSILHHSAWAAGTELTAKDSAGTSAATVCELPFKDA